MSDAGHPHDGHETAEHHEHDHGVAGPGYATSQAAIEESERETVAYVVGLYVGTDVDAPDFLAVVDVDPDSETYCEVVDRLEMPAGPARAHEIRWPDGDCTSDVWQ